MGRSARFARLSGCILLLLTSAALPSPSTPSDLTQANALLQRGHVQEAEALLHSILTAQPSNALAHQLLCRVYYAQDLSDQSVQECQLAVANAPSSSDDHLWLGRA